MNVVIILGLFFLGLGIFCIYKAPEVYERAYHWEEGYKGMMEIGVVSLIIGIIFTILGAIA